MIRHGAGAAAGGKQLVVLYGAGETGKSRLAAACARASAATWGDRVIYLTSDPEGERLGSVLLLDRPNLETVSLELNKDVNKQLEDIYLGKGDAKWMVDEGYKTIITDTLTIAMRTLLGQLADSGKFSEKHIKLSDGHNQPMQGDFLAVGTLMDGLMRAQKSGPFNHIVLCHEQEVRPEDGKPGEVIGGPATVGKANVRSIVNWYNTVLRVWQKPEPRKDLSQAPRMQRFVSTTTAGIWQAKFRAPQLANPIPTILVNEDPVNVWREIHTAQEAQ